MRKSRIYLLLAINTLVLYGLVLFLLRDGDLHQFIIIGITMALMMIAPNLIIRNALNALTREAEEATGALEATKEELARVKSTLSSVTTLDELTGCYNEAHFLEVLIQHSGMSIRGTYVFTMTVLQVDQFSEVVDKHGLASGNDVLQLYTRIVKAALREVDITARLGADKFGLLLSGASEDDAVMVINRISQLISQIKVENDEEIKITNSGGITSYHGTETPEQMVEHANTALDFAIEQGRDRVAGYNYVPPEEGQEPDQGSDNEAEPGPAIDPDEEKT